jgi:hypothetical protein
MDIAFYAHQEDWRKVKQILVEIGGLAIIRRVDDNIFVASREFDDFSDGFYFLWVIEAGFFTVKSLDGSFCQVRDPFVPWVSRHVFGDENVPMIAPISYPKLIHFDVKGSDQRSRGAVQISHLGWVGNKSNEITGDETSPISHQKWIKLRKIINKHTKSRIINIDNAPFPAKLLCFENANKICN